MGCENLEQTRDRRSPKRFAEPIRRHCQKGGCIEYQRVNLTRRLREVRTPLLLEKFLDCAGLLWRFSFDAHKSPTSSAAVVSTAFPRNRASFSRAGSGHANHSKSAGEPAEQASAPDAAGVLHAGLPLLSSARALDNRNLPPVCEPDRGQ